VIDFGPSEFEEKEVSSAEECFPFRDTPTVTWINVDGVHHLDIIERLGHHFGLHPLLLEDIANTGQRPKQEDYGDYLFAVVKMLYYDAGTRKTDAEQVSIVTGPNFVISFQEQEGDVFEEVRGRIRNDKGRIRKCGADYLAYSLIDSIVDNYFVILEGLGERIETVEEELIAGPGQQTSRKIHRLKGEALFVRKSVWPLREVIGSLARGDSKLIKPDTLPYLRDVYDHIIQVADTVDTYRDMISGMLDTYLSALSNRLNEVMKVLTIIATIFIPLTFVAGLYGMNFKNMPELEWPWGYPTALAVMAAAAGLMLVYFKRKKWL